jgi:CheY-like chemotaxis protein
MAKIMLVEDDNSLREIYEARLVAEGYQVVSAKDGEEALALALKEHPDLIIADIMMPKVSGFDMLDILRSTPETKHTKIIMMTALSQAEDKARAEKLGADRYLVKSQVTLEDVTREARTMLDELDQQAAATVAKVEGRPPAAPSPVPSAAPAPAAAPTKPIAKPAAAAAVPKPAQPAVTTIPVAAPDDDDDDDDQNTADTVKDEKLEAAAEALSQPVKKEEAAVKEQVDEFIASNPTLSTSAEPEKKDDSNNTAASDAVDSLTKPASAKAQPQPVDEARGYVADEKGSDDKASSSLAHTKTIQPTPEAARASGKPNLDELLAKEGEAGGASAAPAVNSVISPNDTGGAPPAS